MKTQYKQEKNRVRSLHLKLLSSEPSVEMGLLFISDFCFPVLQTAFFRSSDGSNIPFRWWACCCQVASVMSDSVWPHRQQPTRLLRPWDSPGKNTGVGCYFLLQCMKVKSEREVAQSCPTLGDPMDCSPPGFSIHGISRQEYWSGVPSPFPGDQPRSKWTQVYLQLSGQTLIFFWSRR